MRDRVAGFVDVVDGGRLHYEMAGAGPVVTFLHPGLWDARTWDPQFEPWSERFRLLRYDQRGYGRSSRPEGTPYSHVRDLVALLDHLGIQRTAPSTPRPSTRGSAAVGCSWRRRWRIC